MVSSSPVAGEDINFVKVSAIFYMTVDPCIKGKKKPTGGLQEAQVGMHLVKVGEGMCVAVSKHKTVQGDWRMPSC